MYVVFGQSPPSFYYEWRKKELLLWAVSLAQKRKKPLLIRSHFRPQTKEVLVMFCVLHVRTVYYSS